MRRGKAAALRLSLAVSRLSPAWRGALPGAGALARRAAKAALAGAARRDGRRLAGAAELSLVLADDALLHHLNRQYRHVDKPTNVLSFPGGAAPASAADGFDPERSASIGDDSAGGETAPAMLGDVVLAVETVTAEAAAQGKAMADHFSHLVVHGVLHLLGYDHLAAAEAEAMESLEVEVLAGLGVADPYRPGVVRAGRDGDGRPRPGRSHGGASRKPRPRKSASGRGAVIG